MLTVLKDHTKIPLWSVKIGQVVDRLVVQLLILKEKITDSKERNLLSNLKVQIINQAMIVSLITMQMTQSLISNQTCIASSMLNAPKVTPQTLK